MWIVLLTAIGMPILVGLLFLRVQLNRGLPDDPRRPVHRDVTGRSGPPASG